MKKFDRLSPEQRKNEIQQAALLLFREKGFASTTMENIVDRVSLSKGGVYRLYPSTAAILGDLMIRGMRMRNAYYQQSVQAEAMSGRPLTIAFLVEMIGDSLLLYPEFSEVYAEFLWEKRRRPDLEALYQEICDTSVQETTELIRANGAADLLLSEESTLHQLTDLMNATVLSLHALQLQDIFQQQKEAIRDAILIILQSNTAAT